MRVQFTKIRIFNEIKSLMSACVQCFYNRSIDHKSEKKINYQEIFAVYKKIVVCVCVCGKT